MSLPPDPADEAHEDPKPDKNSNKPPYPERDKEIKPSEVLKVSTVLEGWKKLTEARKYERHGKLNDEA